MLDNVINYNFPAKSKLFVHRVGKSSYTLSLGNSDNCNMRKIRPLNQLLYEAKIVRNESSFILTGRVARAGRTGSAYSFVASDEVL